jgi:hypothetical protein
MGFIENLFSNGAANLVTGVGNTLDNLITSKEEKLNLDLELKKAEMQFNVEMKKLSVEERKMYLEDTASARQMAQTIQTSTAAPWLAKNISPILAIGTTLLTFFLFYIVVFKTPDEKNKDIVVYILGALSAIVTQIFSFYFGSSEGSAKKSVDLQKQLEYHTHKKIDN